MVKVEKLVKSYGPIKAVRDVSFKVNKGDILGFLGPNGAGKSTTMKMITGFLTPDSGTARVGGFDIRENPIEAKSRIGYLPESGPLYGEMTVLEFLKFIAEIRGIRDPEAQVRRVDDIVGLCHLEGVLGQTIDTLSKGYRQRVGFAQAVMHDPPVLIMDEPTDGLDPNQKQEVRGIIKRMSENKAIILSTHILEEVEALCNRVIIIARGKVVVDETPQQLRQRHPLVNSLLVRIKDMDLPKTVAALGEFEGVEKVEENGENALVIPRKKQKIDRELLAWCHEKGWTLTHFEKAPASLDRVFFDLTATASYDRFTGAGVVAEPSQTKAS